MLRRLKTESPENLRNYFQLWPLGLPLIMPAALRRPSSRLKHVSIHPERTQCWAFYGSPLTQPAARKRPSASFCIAASSVLRRPPRPPAGPALRLPLPSWLPSLRAAAHPGDQNRWTLNDRRCREKEGSWKTVVHAPQRPAGDRGLLGLPERQKADSCCWRRSGLHGVVSAHAAADLSRLFPGLLSRADCFQRKEG